MIGKLNSKVWVFLLLVLLAIFLVLTWENNPQFFGRGNLGSRPPDLHGSCVFPVMDWHDPEWQKYCLPYGIGGGFMGDFEITPVPTQTSVVFTPTFLAINTPANTPVPPQPGPTNTPIEKLEETPVATSTKVSNTATANPTTGITATSAATETSEPELTAVPTETLAPTSTPGSSTCPGNSCKDKPTKTPKPRCDNGGGNGPEGCSPSPNGNDDENGGALNSFIFLALLPLYWLRKVWG
jgi:hypothetical protein